jgi:hypothetical protein
MEQGFVKLDELAKYLFITCEMITDETRIEEIVWSTYGGVSISKSLTIK